MSRLTKQKRARRGRTGSRSLPPELEADFIRRERLLREYAAAHPEAEVEDLLTYRATIAPEDKELAHLFSQWCVQRIMVEVEAL